MTIKRLFIILLLFSIIITSMGQGNGMVKKTILLRNRPVRYLLVEVSGIIGKEGKMEADFSKNSLTITDNASRIDEIIAKIKERDISPRPFFFDITLRGLEKERNKSLYKNSRAILPSIQDTIVLADFHFTTREYETINNNYKGGTLSLSLLYYNPDELVLHIDRIQLKEGSKNLFSSSADIRERKKTLFAIPDVNTKKPYLFLEVTPTLMLPIKEMERH